MTAPSDAVGTRARWIRGRGLGPALILVSVGLVEGIETNLTAGALPFLQDEFHFGDTLAGAIPTAAAIAGLASSLPGGYLADRYRRTSILGLVVASWAVLSTASTLATSFWMFFATRVVLGSANHLYNPAVASLLTDFYRPAVRARIFALQRVAQILGIAFGIGIGGLVGEAFGCARRVLRRRRARALRRAGLLAPARARPRRARPARRPRHAGAGPRTVAERRAGRRGARRRGRRRT